MKKSIPFILLSLCLFISNSLLAHKETPIEFSSVSAFFRMADKIGTENTPSEKEWSELFATDGYSRCIAATFDEKEMFLRRAMELAYDPRRQNEKDSIMNIPGEEISEEWETLLLRVILANFIEIKENESDIKEMLLNLDDSRIYGDAISKLRSFLVNPVDSLIYSIPVSLVFMEPDILNLSGNMIWDCNRFLKQSSEERTDRLAREMFLSYISHFSSSEIRSPLIKVILSWQNEGIADLIDKKSLADLSVGFTHFGLPESYVSEYNRVYNITPSLIKDLEQLTISYINDEISEDEFNTDLSDFIRFGGTPTGYYISTLIREAGYEKEMISGFASPVIFMELYNRCISEEYSLSDTFMEYLKNLK